MQSCRDALASRGDNHLHLIERISIDLQVQNSIVPSAVNLSRFKVSGKLPTLQLNISDSKYKSIMRLIDVAIPRFSESSLDVERPSIVAPSRYPLSSGLFGAEGADYTVDDVVQSDRLSAPSVQDDDGDHQVVTYTSM